MIGVALGGGAARGWAHIGVLRALEDAGIRPNVLAGTSIGAVVGGCYAANRLDEVEEFARSLTRRRVFGYLDFNFAGSGLISGQRLCDTLDVYLKDHDIEDLQTRFAAVATEIGTGHEIWLSRGNLVEAMRASYALPGIFRPVLVNGRWLFDGALVNPIPVSVCRAMGANIVIAININADMCGRGTVIPTDVSMPSLAEDGDGDDAAPPKAGNGRAALKLLHRQFFGRRNSSAPGISTVMVDAFNIVQDRISRSRLAGDPPDLLVSPRLSGVGLFDFHRAADLIEAGRQATERAIDELRDLTQAHPDAPAMDAVI